MYKIIIDDKTYSSWKIYDESDNEVSIDCSPITHKLFSGSTFNFCPAANKPSKLLNPISGKKIPGVLILTKTYGKDHARFLYKCIPFDKHLPVFIIPYKISSSFDKCPRNKYILFEYKNWTTKNPLGMLDTVFGDTNDETAYYDYEIYCRNLHYTSRKLYSALMKSRFKNGENSLIQEIQTKHKFKDHTDSNENYIFTIDPKGSEDFDDAVSIYTDPESQRTTINVYIANVALWIDELELWEYLTKKVSTIYLPNKKIPMLPALLSDHLCSLKKNKQRFALCMSLDIIDPTNLMNVIIRFNYLKKLAL